MGSFTFVPVWVIQDLIILIMSIVGVIFIIKIEEKPIAILLEFFCFIFFYAAIYENFATIMEWYGYGRSILMLFNVPITVPIIEYLVVYTSIRLLNHLQMPTWSKPFIVGYMGMLFDFTLDPLAIKQIFTTKEATIGRWTWFIHPNDVNILGEPVYNFSGWVLLCGFAALFLLLGRWWFAKTNRNKIVGFVYPFLSMIAALLLLISPVSSFLLWLGPFMNKGEYGEWIMLGIWFVLPTVLLVIYGRKYTKRISFKKEYLLFLVLIGTHIINIIFTLIGRYYLILPLEIAFSLFQSLIIIVLYYRSRGTEQVEITALKEETKGGRS